MMFKDLPPNLTDEDTLLAQHISEEEYVRLYVEQATEWVEGYVIEMASSTVSHQFLLDYLHILIGSYFAYRPIGQTIRESAMLRMTEVESRREPDLMVILTNNSGELTETTFFGSPEICIEVVSDESVRRDYGTKFWEYERGRVAEYWIIDPLRERCTFNRLTPNGKYQAIQPNEAGVYSTPLLPQFQLTVATLWQSHLPNVLEIVEAVKGMIGYR